MCQKGRSTPCSLALMSHFVTECSPLFHKYSHDFLKVICGSGTSLGGVLIVLNESRGLCNHFLSKQREPLVNKSLATFNI